MINKTFKKLKIDDKFIKDHNIDLTLGLKKLVKTYSIRLQNFMKKIN